MEKVNFTRSELYELIWKFPISVIQKNYNVTRLGVKNACIKMEIPVPKSTYWLKFKYDKENKRPLSIDYKGLETVAIPTKRYEIKLRSTSKRSTLLSLSETIKNGQNSTIKVPSGLVDPKDIICRTKDFWDKNTIVQNSVKEDDEILYFNVSRANMPRALLFMDTFIKILENRGHQFEKGKDNKGAVIINKDIYIDVFLREALKRIPPRAGEDTADYVFTGVFIFRFTLDTVQKEWRDGKILIEDQLSIITAKMELLVAKEVLS